MKKTLAAVAAVLILICFAGGCLRDDAPTLSTEPQTITELVTESLTNLSETTDLPDPTTTVTAKSTTTTTTSAAAKPEATTKPETTTTAKPETTTTKPETTAKPETTKPTTTTTTKPTSMQTPTTRLSLLERWRERRDQLLAPKPDPDFFNDAVFVGDSVTQGLRNYATRQRNKGNECLGAAQFLCYGSMSYTNALQKVSSQSMHPVYKGKKVTVEDGVQLCGAKKVFIMLGMNDFSGYSEKTWKQSVCTLLDRIEEKNPDVSIYLQSVTPIISGMEHGRFTNANIQKFNDYLMQICSDRGCTYVDIYQVLADESGHLKKSYCGDPEDMGIHMSGSGCAAWAKYLQETFCGA